MFFIGFASEKRNNVALLIVFDEGNDILEENLGQMMTYLYFL